MNIVRMDDARLLLSQHFSHRRQHLRIVKAAPGSQPLRKLCVKRVNLYSCMFFNSPGVFMLYSGNNKDFMPTVFVFFGKQAGNIFCSARLVRWKKIRSTAIFMELVCLCAQPPAPYQAKFYPAADQLSLKQHRVLPCP